LHDPTRPVDDASRPGTSLHAANPILRDLLAADRTRLANERTLLAYVRTAIGFVAGGVGLLYLLDVGAFEVTGWVLVAASVVTLVIGVTRYRSVARDLAAFKADLGLRGRPGASGGSGRERAAV
jgi:putative membrane protein